MTPLAAPRRSRAARMLELGAALLVIAGFALVGVSALPVVARELGVSKTRVVQREFARSAPVGQAGVDAVHDFERGVVRDVSRSVTRQGELDVEPARPPETTRIVFSSRDVPLYEGPSKKSRQVGLARSGAPLVVQQQEGGWVLVVHLTEDGLEVGWIPAQEVSLP